MLWASLFMDWWWELLLLLKVWWNLWDCWIMTNWCVNFQVLWIFECLFLYMTCKHIWDEFWAFERSIFRFWVKRVWNPKLFDRTDDRSLERAPSEKAQLVLDTGRLSEPQASFKRVSPEATGSWLLKRATLRLSEQHPVQQLFVFRFVHLGTNPGFLKCFFWLV